MDRLGPQLNPSGQGRPPASAGPRRSVRTSSCRGQRASRSRDAADPGPRGTGTRWGAFPGLLALALAISAAACGSSTPDCPSGQTACGGTCVDLQTDEMNCGVCSGRCPSGATCNAGRCECPAGQVSCGSACADLATDAANCGACGVACGIGTCAGGVCQCEGATFCAGLQPLCRDLLADAASCGTCGRDCPLANDVCEGGACACPASLPTACSTRCANTQTDAANCGACARDCPLENDVCVGGACACPSALPDECGTRCVDRQTDEANCGGCGTVCATGATCTAGTCQCPAGQTACGTGAAARCVNLQTDAANCGTCGRACPAGATCASGGCVCGASTPLACGASCCAGTACCGTACQTRHYNGVNADYFDCGELDQHTLAQARLAAASWSPGGTTYESGLCLPSCLCRQNASQAAVWCYGTSPYKGFVTVTNSPNCFAAACPIPTNPRSAWR